MVDASGEERQTPETARFHFFCQPATFFFAAFSTQYPAPTHPPTQSLLAPPLILASVIWSKVTATP